MLKNRSKASQILKNFQFDTSETGISETSRSEFENNMAVYTN